MTAAGADGRRVRKQGAEQLYEEINRVLDEAFVRSGSLLTPGRQVWTPDTVEEF